MTLESWVVGGIVSGAGAFLVWRMFDLLGVRRPKETACHACGSEGKEGMEV
ncbi:MAG: hypothetical protein HYY93_14585 [Planctomycetes bacterium]|nr:hypothetical protein [Planctomycetota bacterium]